MWRNCDKVPPIPILYGRWLWEIAFALRLSYNREVVSGVNWLEAWVGCRSGNDAVTKTEFPVTEVTAGNWVTTFIQLVVTQILSAVCAMCISLFLISFKSCWPKVYIKSNQVKPYQVSTDFQAHFFWCNCLHQIFSLHSQYLYAFLLPMTNVCVILFV